MEHSFTNTLGARPLRAALAVAWCRHGPSVRLLATRRPEGKRFAGLWEWPGGKVEVAETPAHAACRELAEETGLQANAAQAAHIGEHLDEGPPAILFSVFAFELPGQPAPTCIGCSDARWLEPHAALALPSPPANLAINRLVAAWLTAARSAPPEPRPSGAR